MADKDEAPRLLPGSLTIWQGAATAFGGMLITSLLTVNKLDERSTQDRANIAELKQQVSALSVTINGISVEIARQSVLIQQQVSPSSKTDTRITLRSR